MVVDKYSLKLLTVLILQHSQQPHFFNLYRSLYQLVQRSTVHCMTDFVRVDAVVKCVPTACWESFNYRTEFAVFDRGGSNPSEYK